MVGGRSGSSGDRQDQRETENKSEITYWDVTVGQSI